MEEKEEKEEKEKEVKNEQPKKKHSHGGHRERVREKFLISNFDTFADHEVLEMLLFYTIPLRDTNEMAHKLIEEFGSLAILFDAPPQEIERRCKVSANVAVLIAMVPALSKRYFLSKWDKKECFDSSKKAGTYSIALCTDLKVECFFLICLTSQRALIHAAKVSEGTLLEAPIYTREVIATALKYNASSVILVHNHPSGIKTPSKSDIVVTERLITALNGVSVEVLDHIVVAGQYYHSFSENKTLPLWY